LAGALSLAAFSCGKKLDIQPRQSVDAATALTTPDDVDKAMIGAYSVMGVGALYGTNLVMVPELLASTSYCSWTGTFQGARQIARKTMTADNSEASRIWINAYQAINMANTVLANLNVVTDPAQKTELEGEALWVRAIMHFELVRLFALPYDPLTPNSQLGVPIVATATKNEADALKNVPRNTVAEVYTQVIADLVSASTKLPNDNGNRADRFTALAFLARVYLQQSDFAKARDAANAVIGSGIYEMNGSLTAGFLSKNTKESIFEIQQNDQNNAGTANDGLATFFASLPGVGRGDVTVSGTFLGLHSPGDNRRTQLYYVGSGAKPGSNMCGKWTSFSQNIPIVRIAEMYLIRAECNRRLGTNIGDTPENDLDVTRSRAGLPFLAAPTVNDILLERRLELAFEGQRVHDVRRQKGATGAFNWDAPKLVMPIPIRDINANPLLVQNPGY
jgi:starch-binding outer membrane protein, SusD/RagB family